MHSTPDHTGPSCAHPPLLSSVLAGLRKILETRIHPDPVSLHWFSKTNIRETTAHFSATGLPSQQNRSDNAFRFKRAAFYIGLKSKVGLVAAKASALRINLNIQSCSIVAPPLHAPSRAPLLLPLLHTISLSPAFISARWAD